MFKHFGSLLALSAGVALTGAQSMPPKVVFSEYRLPNGLHVIYSIDHSAPVVAVSVTYNVGSRNEVKGRTGFAHLFEHMMFQGSANVGKGEHMLLVQDNGGTMNGTTNKDRTNYFETVPSNQLGLALYLEADRMRSLDISPANLTNQREVVKEEKRQSYDNQPYGGVEEKLDAAAYDSFAYQHTTIGSMDDLNAASIDDVKQFFKTYYAPNNAVIAIVGDFSEDELKAKIQENFGEIPRQPDPPPVVMDEKINEGEKRISLNDNLARIPRYQASYKTVDGNNPDSYALQLLSRIISGGRSSPLYKGLVEPHLALSANAGAQFGRGPALFTFTASVDSAAAFPKVEDAFGKVIADLQANGVTQEQLDRAKTQVRAASIVGFGGGGRGGRGGGGANSVLTRANGLSQNAVFFDDPDRINTNLAKLQAVTLDDIKRVANTYFNTTNRVVVTVTPVDNGDGGF